MRSPYLIAGAVVLALVAAGVLFATDFFQRNPIESSQSPTPTSAEEGRLLKQMARAATVGGVVATFAEKDARRWKLGPGHRLERFSLDSSGGVFARLSSASRVDAPAGNWEEYGLSLPLPLPFGQQMNGKKVEIGIVARSPQSNGSPDVSIVYATQQSGNSGWRTFNLSSRFELKTFQWVIPALPEGYTASPIVVVHADKSGAGRTVEILGVYVKPID